VQSQSPFEHDFEQLVKTPLQLQLPPGRVKIGSYFGNLGLSFFPFGLNAIKANADINKTLNNCIKKVFLSIKLVFWLRKIFSI